MTQLETFKAFLQDPEIVELTALSAEEIQKITLRPPYSHTMVNLILDLIEVCKNRQLPTRVRSTDLIIRYDNNQ
jgi:hypothetical protein